MYKYVNILICVCAIPAMADVVTVTPDKLDFGSHPLGTQAFQEVILSNPTKKAVNISSIAASGDFTVLAQYCGSVLSAGSKCYIDLLFSPTSVGAATESLTINDDANNTPQKVKLSGIGTPPQLVSITVTPSGAVVPVGMTRQFAATGTLTNHVNVDLTSTAQWSSSAPTASVNAAGLVAALSPGVATISAASAGVAGSAPMSILPPVVTSLKVSPTNFSVGSFTTHQFTVTGSYSDSTTADLTAVATWSSSNTAVATVSASGLVSTTQPGVTAIRALVPAGSGFFLDQTGTLEVAFFSSHSMLSSPRAGHSAVRLNDGRVLVSGGVDSTSLPVSSTDILNPEYLFLTPGPAMAMPRWGHTTTLLPGGRVLVAGGGGNPTAELFDPVSGLFAPTSDLNVNRINHTATLLNNGQVLIAGGNSNTAELYDPFTGMFTPTGSMAVSRASHTATLLNDGRVLIAGGSPSTMIELYDPATGVFNSGGALTTDRTYHAAARLADGRVLLIGGQSGQGFTSSVDLYDPATGAISTAPPMRLARAYHTATLLQNGQVLVAGGLDGEFDPTAVARSIERFDPTTGTFAGSGNMATYPTSGVRVYHTATLLQSGQVLLAGGIGDHPNGTAEVYEPGVPYTPGLQ